MDSTGEEYGADQAVTGLARSELVVSVRGLVKRYGSHVAVAGTDLEVRRGDLRLPRPERRGQDHDSADPRRLPAAHSGPGFCPGARPGHGGGRLAGPGGRGLAGDRARPDCPGVPGHVRRRTPRDVEETIALLCVQRGFLSGIGPRRRCDHGWADDYPISRDGFGQEPAGEGGGADLGHGGDAQLLHEGQDAGQEAGPPPHRRVRAPDDRCLAGQSGAQRAASA